MSAGDTYAENIRFRPIQAEDETLLNQIYASTRTEELARVDWPQAQKDAFLNQQFLAQHHYYLKVYPDAFYWIILLGDQTAGRLYLHHGNSSYRIIDIALLPEFRNRGIGAYVLQQIITDAFAHGKSVSIHVEHFNPALHLYERLGFKHIDTFNSVYYLMECTPETYQQPA
ncbi:MAG: GNAT family N-acetyltransferase [Bacteroidetes bacterium]|nr:GNAT family N-acetyltransferase [Bacteroidota bacterium]